MKDAIRCLVAFSVFRTVSHCSAQTISPFIQLYKPCFSPSSTRNMVETQFMFTVNELTVRDSHPSSGSWFSVKLPSGCWIKIVQSIIDYDIVETLRRSMQTPHSRYRSCGLKKEHRFRLYVRVSSINGLAHVSVEIKIKEGKAFAFLDVYASLFDWMCWSSEPFILRVQQESPKIGTTRIVEHTGKMCSYVTDSADHHKCAI